MDSNSKPNQLTEARGLNTNAARGTQPAPYVLNNALLHPGGWKCAPAAKSLVPNVIRAIYAGQGDDLYIEQVDKVSLYGAGILNPVTDGQNLDLAGAVTLGRDLVYAPASDKYLSRTFGARSLRYAASIPIWDGSATPPSGMYVENLPAPNNGSNAWSKAMGDTVYVRIVPIRGPDAIEDIPYLWPTELAIPLRYDLGNIIFHNLTFSANFYAKQAGEWFFVGTNFRSGKRTDTLYIARTSELPLSTDILYFRPNTADYHNGRIYAAGGSSVHYEPTSKDGTVVVASPGTRLWFSGVVANFADNSLPFFAEDYYLDIPFKISKTIVAVQSSGRYLYIFGEREIMLLSGNDDSSWNIESIGDSIGAVSAASVQRLQNTTIYLSDSGVALLQGGQVADISADVRDLIANLDRSTITSTVDFERELYLLSDGTTTLVYHLREQGWTTRSVDGPGQQLVYGGGTPYSVHSGGLYSLNSAELMAMGITVGPFLGDWTKRTQWRGVAAGLDTDSAAVQVSAWLEGQDVGSDGLTQRVVTGTASTTSQGEGVTPVNLHLASLDGVELSAVLCGVRLLITPTADTRRCILRPPFTLLSNNNREANSR